MARARLVGAVAVGLLLAACAGEGDEGDEGGTVDGTRVPAWSEQLTGVSLACGPSVRDDAGERAIDCRFGEQPPDDGVQLTLVFTTDYAAAGEAVLSTGTDFSIYAVGMYAGGGGFGVYGTGSVAGQLTIALGAREATTPAVLSGALSDGYGDTFTLALTDVPARLP